MKCLCYNKGIIVVFKGVFYPFYAAVNVFKPDSRVSVGIIAEDDSQFLGILPVENYRLSCVFVINSFPFLYFKNGNF